MKTYFFVNQVSTSFTVIGKTVGVPVFSLQSLNIILYTYIVPVVINTFVECVVTCITFQSRNVIVGVFYRPDNLINGFTAEFAHKFPHFAIIIIGDFNFPDHGQHDQPEVRNLSPIGFSIVAMISA